MLYCELVQDYTWKILGLYLEDTWKILELERRTFKFLNGFAFFGTRQEELQ